MCFRPTQWMLCHRLLHSQFLKEQSEEKEKPEMPYIGVAAWTQNADSRNPILRAISGPETKSICTATPQ